MEPAPLQGLAEAVRNLEKIHSPLQSTERLWTVLLECACIMIPSSTGCVLKGEGGNWQLLSAFGADADVNSILAFVNGSWDHRSNSLPADIFSLPAEPWVQTADVESRGLVFLPFIFHPYLLQDFQPSSAAAEHVFSFLRRLWSEQQTAALSDLIKLSLFLCFNQRDLEEE